MRYMVTAKEETEDLLIAKLKYVDRIPKRIYKRLFAAVEERKEEVRVAAVARMERRITGR